MVDFGDDLIMESYTLPWLIWIQLLVTILLIVILFFGLASFTSDASSSAAAADLSTSCEAAAACLNNSASSSNGVVVQVEGERAGSNAGTRGGSIREEEEESVKDTAFLSIFRHPNHPCNYLGFAKNALFKCFGLDSSSESSSGEQHEKRD